MIQGRRHGPTDPASNRIFVVVLTKPTVKLSLISIGQEIDADGSTVVSLQDSYGAADFRMDGVCKRNCCGSTIRKLPTEAKAGPSNA